MLAHDPLELALSASLRGGDADEPVQIRMNFFERLRASDLNRLFIRRFRGSLAGLGASSPTCRHKERSAGVFARQSCHRGNLRPTTAEGAVRSPRRQKSAFEALANSGDRWRQSLRTRPHDLSLPLRELVQSPAGSLFRAGGADPCSNAAARSSQYAARYGPWPRSRLARQPRRG